MLKFHKVDLEYNLIDYMVDLINHINNKIIFISTNRRPIKFIEQKLAPQKVLQIDFYQLEEFIKDFVLKHYDLPLKVQSKLERYYLILEILKTNKVIFKKLGGSDTKIFPWAKRVSSLFDEIDKNNLGEKLQNFAYTELVDQAKVIVENLKDLYSTYRNKLQEKNLTYNGDLFLKMVEILKKMNEHFKFENTSFIFNNLIYISNTETVILKMLAEKSDVHLIVSTDLSKICNPFHPFEAIDLLEKRLKSSIKIEYVEKKGGGGGHKLQRISFYASPDKITEMNQLTNILIDKKPSIEAPTDTAIIMPDETALFPLLINLPHDYPSLNITMGYPFTSTAFYTFILNFLEMVMDAKEDKDYKSFSIPTEKILSISDSTAIFYDENLNKELYLIKNNSFQSKKSITTIDKYNHPTLYNIINQFKKMKNISELTNNLEDLINSINRYPTNDLKNYIFQINTILLFRDYYTEALKKLPSDTFVDIEMAYIIFKEVSKDISIPFEGSPLKGLQIMGILESRGLKFKNVFIPDMNEGVFPSYDKVDPLISESIKREIGLPSYKEKEILMRYNFYRIIYSSEKVYIFFKDGMTANQKYIKSRYIEQLIFLKELEKNGIFSEINLSKPDFFVVKKDEDSISVSHQISKERYSATMLDYYLTCPYKYYLKFVKQIEAPVRLDLDFKADITGNIVHYLLEKGIECNKSVSTNFSADNVINELDRIRNTNVNDKDIPEIANYIKEMDELEYSMFKLLLKYRLEQFENQHCENEILKQSTVIAKEKVFYHDNLYGKIDRIDKIENEEHILVIDYKTGSTIKPLSKNKVNSVLDSIDTLDFTKDNLKFIKENISSVQILMYLTLVKNNPEYKADKYTGLYYFFGKNEIKSFEYIEGVEEITKYLISHIEKADIVYSLPGQNCLYCDYNRMCKFADA